MEREDLLSRLKGKLIVSCQALDGEPLSGLGMMGNMAKAAKVGGAAAIRANGGSDVSDIKAKTNLPVIGIVKQHYENSEVFITPTIKEIDELLQAKADIIALDATTRLRPEGISLEELVQHVRKKSSALIMGDVSTVQEGILASELGVDILSTTLSGYTPYSPQLEGPDFTLIKELTRLVDLPVIAEGRIRKPEEASRALRLGAYSVVVGAAITRPHLITRRFTDALENYLSIETGKMCN
ncbi:putative N-acetylmannosamine-6-phosphate 2-epimerase [Heyndrickxia sporothermodurans]|nr:putative N-acetylmannosamine-6-phosphate 2-epimerase [Heyndrickxia sporothermodurans]